MPAVFASVTQAQPSLSLTVSTQQYSLRCYGLPTCTSCEVLHTASAPGSPRTLGICYLVHWSYQSRTSTCKHLQAYLGTRYGLSTCASYEVLHTASAPRSPRTLGICYLVHWSYQSRTFTCKHLQTYLGAHPLNSLNIELLMIIYQILCHNIVFFKI